jgi:hypothetical protein
MTYKFSVLTERLEYWMLELNSNIKVIDEAYNFTNIEITINNSTELLSIFHAGVLAGCDACSAKRA